MVFPEFLKKIFSISAVPKMNTQQIQIFFTLLKSAHRVQYVVKWAHGVPKIDTPYYGLVFLLLTENALTVSLITFG